MFRHSRFILLNANVYINFQNSILTLRIQALLRLSESLSLKSGSITRVVLTIKAGLQQLF